MMKLFKAKSLKNNTKTRENAGAGVRAGNKSRTKEKSKGRSMVEMLGVLAIIGVLSIGGISGYTMAMRKYRANEILNLASKYALTLYTSCQNAMMNNPKEYYKYDRYDTLDWNCPAPLAFTDSGLGPLPSGVVSIVASYIAYYDSKYDPTNMPYIASKSSGDFVGLKITFDSKELCETVQSITGQEWVGRETKTSCENYTLTLLNFMEN